MSVIMTMTMPGDRQELERFAAQNKEAVRAIASQAKEHGVIAHRFYGTEGRIMVADEWPDEQSFQRFFADSPEVADMMERAHAGKPEIHFWRHLDVDDDIG